MKQVQVIMLLGALLVVPGAVHANPFLKPADQGVQAPASSIRGSALPSWLLEWQLDFREDAGELMRRFSEGGEVGIFWAILGLTFVYGVLHALGPGHRKTVVFSLFLGRKAPWWQPLGAGMLAGGTHGAMSIGLILVLLLVRAGVAHVVEADQAALWIESAAAVMLLGLSLWLIIRKARHGHHCHHGPEGSNKSVWAVVVSTSLVPCSGATMVLLLALYLDAFVVGALAVLSMSMGMGLVVSGAGFLAWGGREAFFSHLKAREKTVQKVADAFEYLAYVTLLVMGILAVMPLVAMVAGF